MNLFQRPPARRAVSSDRRAGFSLIELLTVIAIIAILAAVLFPAITAVRIRAQHGQLISNMKDLHAALGIYRTDEHGYPPSLGPVILGAGGTTTQYGHLYPEFMKNRSSFHSPRNELENPDELYGPILFDRRYVSEALPPGVSPQSDPARLSGAKMHGWNTMDGHVDESGRYVLHYSRFRTLNKQDPDYKRQLGFRNPPEDTVVTWNDTFADKEGGQYTGRGDLFVLFLNGTVKKYSMRDGRVREVNGEFWRLKPY